MHHEASPSHDRTGPKWAEEELKRRVEQLTSLSQAVQAVTSSLELDQVLARIVSLASQVVASDYASIVLVNEEGRLGQSAEDLPGLLDIKDRIRPGGFTRWIVRSRQAVVVDDIGEDGTVSPRPADGAPSTVNPFIAKAGVKSFVGLPLVSKDRLLGVLYLHSLRPAHFRDHLPLLTAFANQAAIAIENARLFEAEQHKRQVADTLRETSRIVTSALDLDEVLHLVLEQLERVLSFEAAVILLLDEKRDELYIRISKGYPPETPPLSLPLSGPRGITVHVARTGQPIYVPDVSQDERYVSCGFDGRSEMAAPLKIKDKVIGVLNVESRQADAYSKDDLELLVAFAAHVSIAIENARLYEAERKRAAQLAVVNQVARQIALILDLDQLFQEVVTAIRQGFNYYNVALFLLDETANELEMRAIAGDFEDMAAPDYRQAVGVGMIGWTAQTGQPLLANDVRQEPRYILGCLEEALTRSELCVPLKLAGQVIGVLDVQDPRLNAFDETDLMAMETLADQIAMAIENARLFKETKRRFEETMALYQTSLDVTARLEMPELLKSILERAVTLLRAEAGGIYLYAPEREELRWVIGHDDTGKYVWVNLKPGEGMAGRVFQTGEPLIVDDYCTWEGRAAAFEASQSPTAVLGVPLKWQEQVIGVLLIDANAQERTFNQNDIWLATLFANQAAVAIENARIYEEERKRATQLELIGGVTQKIASILNLDELLRQVAHLIGDTFGYYYTSILLVEASSNELVLRASAGPSIEALVGRLRLKIGQEGITGWVAQSSEPLLVNDVSREPRYYSTEESKDTRSELAVPIKLKGEVIGVLDVQSIELDAFSQDDVFILQTLADQLAVAIENAHIYEEERKRATQLELISGITQKIASILDLDELLSQVTRLITDTFGYYYIGIFLADADSNELVLRASIGPFGRVLLNRPRLKIGQEGITGWVAQSGEPLLVDDVSHEPRYYSLEELKDIRSELAVPIKLKGEIIGAIDVGSDKLGAFSQDDVFILQTLADQLAVAIENARLYERVTGLAAELELRVQERTEELVHKAQELSFLYQASVALSSTLEAEEALRTLAEQAALAVDAVDCTICELQGDVLTVVANYQDPTLPWKNPEIGRRCLLADYPATREAIEKGQPLWVRVDDPLADEAERAELQAWGYTAMLQVHIISQDRVVGVVEVFDNKPGREFSESDAALLQTIANQAGMAIERARLFQQVRQERNHLELLYEISRRLSISLDLEQTMRDILQVSAAATGASRGSIFILDDEGRVAHRILMRDLASAEADETSDRVMRKGLAGWVFEHQQPAIVFDTGHDERWLPFPNDVEPVGSAIAIPFIGRDRVRGLLTLVHPQPYHFDQTHLDLLSSIAYQVAMVIERARLHEHAQRRAIQLATAAEVAREATSTLDMSQLLTRTVNLIRDRLGLYYVGIFLLDKTGEYAILRAGTGEPGQQMLQQGHKLRVGGPSMVGQCIARAQAHIAPDMRAEVIRFVNPLLPATRSEMALPLISRGRVIGAMSIQSDRLGAFPEEDIATLQTLADQLANAIENARLYEEIHHWAQEVTRQKEQTEAIMRSMADGLIVTDLENRLVLANPAAEEMLKFRLKEAIGQDIGANIRDERLRQIVRDTLDKQQAGYEVDIELTDPYRIIRARTAVVSEPSGQPRGIVTTLRDVTHEREVQRLKDELISTVSHELRTPLSSVLGFSELLLNRRLSKEKQQLYIQTIHQEAQRLSALINDFLDLQRMERGRLAYHFEEVNLGELAREMVATYSSLSEAHTLTLNLPPDLPPVQADPDRLRQVLGNLLSNAIKFSPHGGRVNVSVQLQDNEVLVAVSDEGIGIPAEALPHLFEKFFRVDSSDQREIQGTGLGLAICKGIVEAHQGRIWAESQEGVGTTITFSLPLMPRKRILAIDDEAAIRELLQKLLGKGGYEVLTAANGQEGLSLIEAERPDLVILDIAIPEMDGYQFLKILKDDRGMKDIPVIAISGVDTDIDRLKELGTDEFLSKPFSSTVLLETVQRLLRVSELR